MRLGRSPRVLVFAEESLNDQRQLRLDNEEVAGHGCRRDRKELAFGNITHVASHHRISERKKKAKRLKKKRARLTSDVVNGDDAGGQQLSRGAESSVPELLVGADA